VIEMEEVLNKTNNETEIYSAVSQKIKAN